MDIGEFAEHVKLRGKVEMLMVVTRLEALSDQRHQRSWEFMATGLDSPHSVTVVWFSRS